MLLKVYCVTFVVATMDRYRKGELDVLSTTVLPWQAVFLHFSILHAFHKSSICTKPSNFSVFSKFYQHLTSGFSINTGKSAYFEAM